MGVINIPSNDIVEPDVLVVSNIVGTRFGQPTTGLVAHTLLICTGTAAFDFAGPDSGGGIRTATLQFFIPDETGNPLDLDKIFGSPRVATLFHEATVASLSSITGGSGPWAVDAVEVTQVGSLVQLNANLAIGQQGHVDRMAYQANLLIGPPG